MRSTARTTAVSAFAVAALLAGAGTAAAEGPVDSVDPVDVDTSAECVYIQTYLGAKLMCLEPTRILEELEEFGYGSNGTGSLSDLVSGIINLGSVVLSVAVPNTIGSLTGFYAPGSTGSYGPEASIGEAVIPPLTASVSGF